MRFSVSGRARGAPAGVGRTLAGCRGAGDPVGTVWCGPSLARASRAGLRAIAPEAVITLRVVLATAAAFGLMNTVRPLGKDRLPLGLIGAPAVEFLAHLHQALQPLVELGDHAVLVAVDAVHVDAGDDDVPRIRLERQQVEQALLDTSIDNRSRHRVVSVEPAGEALAGILVPERVVEHVDHRQIRRDNALDFVHDRTLLIGVGRGELLPYTSFYLTGFLNERPLADLRADLARLGIERSHGRHEPEDHIALLFEVMADMAHGEIAGDQVAFFDRHIGPWAARFFDDLAVAPSAKFYRPLAEIGRLFMDIEARAFSLSG